MPQLFDSLHILLEISCQILFDLLDTKFPPDVFPMDDHCLVRNSHGFGDLAGVLSLTYHLADLDFSWAQIRALTADIDAKI